MILKKIKLILVNLFDRFTATNATISVGDIVNKKNEMESYQFLLTSRLLDIEDFCNHGITSFRWQNSISRKKYGKKHREEGGNKAFIKLIHSFKEKGYNQTSFFTVDHDFRLLDGNHRMGMCLFMGIDTINIRVLKRKVPIPKNIDWYIGTGLETNFIDSVVKKYQEIQKMMVLSGNVFCAVVPNAELMKNFSFLVDVKATDSFLNVGGGVSFEGMDIPLKGVLVRFTLRDPQYYIKNGKVCSRRVENIQKVFQKRNNGTIVISRNCLEGRSLYNLIKPYFI